MRKLTDKDRRDFIDGHIWGQQLAIVLILIYGALRLVLWLLS